MGPVAALEVPDTERQTWKDSAVSKEHNPAGPQAVECDDAPNLDCNDNHCSRGGREGEKEMQEKHNRGWLREKRALSL